MEKISVFTIAFLVLSMLLTLASPLVCVFYCVRSLKSRFWPVLLGAACYLFFGMLFPGATLNLLYFINADWFAAVQTGWLYVLVMSLVSALWMEIGRYNVQKINNDLYAGPTNALAFGLGLSTLPTMLVGIGCVSSLMLAFSVNREGLTAFLQQLQEGGALETEIEMVRAFAGESPLETLWTLLVQVSLYVVQVALTLLVQPGVEKGGDKHLLVICIGLQFLLQWTLTMRDANIGAQNWLTALLCVGITAIITYGTVVRTKQIYPDFKLVRQDYRPITSKYAGRRRR